MKSSTILSLLAVTCTLCSCSDIMEEPVVSSVEMKISQELDYKVTPDEAMEIANGFFKQKLSRSAVLNTDYATITPKSRAESADTLAYIVTPSDGEGFVLVSTDKRMPPVLAFSETGTFSYTESPDDPVYAGFIYNLQKYIKYYKGYGTEGYNFKPEYNLFDKIVELCSEESWEWNQSMLPYTKYVEEEYPGCPVGCVGIATGIAMLYCRDSVTISGEYFDLYAIREGMKNGVSLGPIYGEIHHPKYLDSNLSRLIYSKEQAYDKIAKLLLLIGKNLHFKYQPQKTSGQSYKVPDFLIQLGYDVKCDPDNILNFYKYNLLDIVKEIEQGNIIYIFHTSVHNGHAWIIDGCCFDYMSNSSEITQDNLANVFVHCNWGNYSAANGYFYGDVFYLSYEMYDKMQYLPIRSTREFSSKY